MRRTVRNRWRAFRKDGIDRNSVRRAVLFAAGVGTPILIGTWRDERNAALLGAVIGLVLYFADNDGPLRNRFSILASCAAGLIAGAAAGHALSQYRPIFWIAFVAAVFAAGWLFRLGKAPAMAVRLMAMSMAVSVGARDFASVDLIYAFGTFALVALARLSDHLLCGPLPQLRPGARNVPPTHGGWVRFAIAYAAAGGAGLWIGLMLDPHRALWVAATSLVVMQPDARASYVRVVERIAGAFAGVVAAWLLAQISPTAAYLCVAILILAPLAPHHLADRYWLHTAIIAAVILLANDLAEFGSDAAHGLFAERLEDMLLGCGLALVGTAAAFPRAGRPARGAL